MYDGSVSGFIIEVMAILSSLGPDGKSFASIFVTTSASILSFFCQEK